MLASAPAAADGTRALRLATAAPDGTAWAREFRAFARDVDTLTHGAVKVKWYFGGIAGDEIAVGGRIRRDQLDGAASAGPLCQQLAPSMRVTRLPGLYRSHEEAVRVLHRLTPVLTEEFAKEGYVYLGGPNIGPDVLFSRQPIRSFADLKRTRLWHWDIDETANLAANEAGLMLVPTPITDALATYDNGKADGFLALPTAALAYQWSTRARYLTDLRTEYMCGCLVITMRTFDALPIEHQQTIRAAAAKAIARVDEVSRLTDEQLLGGLFVRQGLQPVPATAELRESFQTATAEARRKLAAKGVVTPALLQKVQIWLDEYREHP